MIAAIIQARLSSTRLPRKLLLQIQDMNLIEHLSLQLSFSKRLDKKIIATTKEEIDNEIVNIADKLNMEYFRGDSSNVLDRYYQCAKFFDLKTIVRISSDAPMIDPQIVDKTIEYYTKNNFDYVNNFFERTFPIGTEIEIFSFEVLEQCWKFAKKSSEKEHVTPFIYNNPDKFEIGCVKNLENLSEFHWTVDRIEDFEFVKSIIERTKKRPILIDDILKIIENEPDLLKINSHVDPFEGYKKSINDD